jgi:alanyl-tRNA synthetase
MTKTVSDIRAGFLDFFKKNGHEIRPSSSLVPHNDPTLMFTNAGMNQFKNVFTGAEKLSFNRAATSQKCVRAGGKHNDLDNVGYTARHHTFFEMLGNFSFGNYFKDDAIKLAWDLLTKDFGLNKDKLYVTVYHTDDEAFNIWKKLTGFPESKIIRIDTNDNFWSMGDTGPCGPCSEIFYDHGAHIPGGLPGTADADGDRYIEIWNLVFMQYEQLAGGDRISLPKPSIDTGMGLERISAVMQGVHDNYDIDLFKNIIAASKQESGNAEHEVSHRVIADHLRSSCFLIADGVMPSNEGRGYVLRRIMRRAMRHAHQLGCKDPLMYKLVPSLIEEMGAQYPELSRAEATITENLRAEEERFKQTLERGLKLLEEETEKLSKGSKLAGEAAFKLYDTYGFPLDLTQDILRNQGLEVDTDGFEKAMENQREMAKAAHKGSGDVATGKIWFELKEKLGANKFLGYDEESAEGKILAIVKDGADVNSANAGDEVYIILDQTPFYGESGGQIGDSGFFTDISTGKVVADIGDTKKPLEDFIIHKALLKSAIKVGDVINAQILVNERNAIRANHSATHLMHKALRDVLGEHVTQKGSLVDATRLRFDFSNNKAVAREEIAEIERRVNEVIARGGTVECKEMSPDDAIKAGAMALFGEKYGDKVRVLGIGKNADGSNYSVELCGGTHARNVADIGIFKITSEGSVASGIRRIEAVTGNNVLNYMDSELAKQYEQIQKLEQDRAALIEEAKKLSVATPATESAPKPKQVKDSLKDASNIYEKESARQSSVIEALQEQNKKLNKQLADAKKQRAMGDIGDVKPEQVGAYSFIAKNFDGLDPKELRGVAETYLKQAQIVIVSTVIEGKVSLVVAVEKAASAKISAVTLVQAAVTELGGKGGGGRPDMAQGGGTDAAALPKAIDKIKFSLG